MKEQIVFNVQHTLPNQLQQLIDYYEQQMGVLQSKIELLQQENEQLQQQVQQSSQHENNVVEQWLEDCQNAVKHNNEMKLQQLTQSVTTPAKMIARMSKEERHATLYQMLDLLASSSNKIDLFIFHLLKNLYGRNVNTDVRRILTDEHQFIIENMEKNADLHSLVVETLLLFNLTALLEYYRSKVLEDVQLLSRLNSDQLIQLFWLSFIVNNEEQFMKNCPAMHKAALQKHELSPFYVYGDKQELNNDAYNRLKRPLNLTPLLTDRQKEEAFAKLNKLVLAEMPELTVKNKIDNSLPKFAKDRLHIVKDADLMKFQQKFNLTEQEIVTNLYTASGKRFRNSKEQLRAFVSPSKDKAFISEHDFNIHYNRNKPKLLIGSMAYYDFKWPTTEIKGTESPVKNELNLKEKSDLRALGYQVSSLTKAERWPILQNAVQQLGLHKVAYTIANNIRLKKSVNNGATIYAKAISEWQHDLDKLKHTYYKKNFNWPK